MIGLILSAIQNVSQMSYSLIYTTIIVTLIFGYITFQQVSKYQFWSKQGINGPKPWPIFGNTFDLMINPMLNRLAERRSKYGPIYGTYRGTMPQLVISDPDMIKDVLIRDWTIFADRSGGMKSGNPVTDNFLTNLAGNDWKRMRSVMSPTFTSGKMKHMFSIMNDCCELMRKNIVKNISQNSSPKGSIELNVRHLAGCYSMDVIAKCCFATETNSFNDPNDVFVSHARKFFQIPKTRLLFAFLTPNWFRKLFKIAVIGGEPVKFLAHVSRSILDSRIQESANNNSTNKDSTNKDSTSKDYLQLLIDASKNHSLDLNSNIDSVVDNESHHGYEDKVSDKVLTHAQIDDLKKPLSTDEIISNSVLFLAVGYDTTSSLITMTTYCLACNEFAQNKLFDEIQSAHKQNGGSFDYETISGLKYLDAVISETLRILPPAPMIERRLIENYTFRKNGISVPKSGSVIIPIYEIHHDATLWGKDVEMFIPERFLPENRHKIIPYSYVPFGGGPRNCIGMRFALLEAKLAIAHLVLNFKFSPGVQTDIPLDLTPTLILLNPKRVFVNVEERI